MSKRQIATPCFAHTLQTIRITPALKMASFMVKVWQCMPLHPLTYVPPHAVKHFFMHTKRHDCRATIVAKFRPFM
jgi:hypothetical protein